MATKQLKRMDHHYSGIKKAQSLLELAVFGSVLIMLLGVLINYGLRYNLQQRLSQQVFRVAMYNAAKAALDGNPESVSHTMITEVHIPNPVDPLGRSSEGFTHVVASDGGIRRTHRLYESADLIAELTVAKTSLSSYYYYPDTYFNTAGFRREIIGERKMEKYEEIYGRNNIWKIEGAERDCLSCWYCTQKISIMAGGWSIYRCREWCEREVQGGGEGVCPDKKGTDCNGWCICCQEPRGSYNTLQQCRDVGVHDICLDWGHKVSIIDSCAGKILDYDTAYRQCRMIVDKAFFHRECDKGRMPGQERVTEEKTCEELASMPTNPPHHANSSYDSDLGGAWYCADYIPPHRSPNGSFIFPRLDDLFAGTYKGRILGIQPLPTVTVTRDDYLNKHETHSMITTTSNSSIQQDAAWEVYHIENTDGLGYSQPVSENVKGGIQRAIRINTQEEIWRTNK